MKKTNLVLEKKFDFFIIGNNKNDLQKNIQDF